MKRKNQSGGKGHTKWLSGPSCGPRAAYCTPLSYAIWSCEASGSLQIDIAPPPPNKPVSATGLESRSRTSRSRSRLLWQSLGLVSKFEPGLGLGGYGLDCMPAAAKIGKWNPFRVWFSTNFWLRARIRVWKKNVESCRGRVQNTGSGVKRNFWPLRNFWLVVFQLFCFREKRNNVW